MQPLRTSSKSPICWTTVTPAFRWSVFTLLLCLTLSGCEKKRERPRPAPEPSKPLAERQFDNILKDLKRMVESKDPLTAEMVPSVEGAGAEWRTTVTHELTKPESESDPYQAIIRIKTESTFTVIKIDQPDLEEQSKANDKQSESATEDLDGTDQLAESSPGLNIPSSPIKTFENSEVRDYELVHEEGRWRLLTEFDPETEKTTEYAFSAALRRQ